jgi:hypothetical protein
MDSKLIPMPEEPQLPDLPQQMLPALAQLTTALGIPREVLAPDAEIAYAYLLALAHADFCEQLTQDKGLWNFHLQHGRFVSRNRGEPQDILNVVEQETQNSATIGRP